MSIERAYQICKDCDPETLDQSAHSISNAIDLVCEWFYSHHRNYLLALAERMMQNYEDASFGGDFIGTRVSIWFFNPKGIGLFEDCHGYHYDLYMDHVEIKKIYLIEGDLVRMKYKTEGYK